MLVVAEGEQPRLRAAVISRAYRKIIDPMTLANMRENGVHSVVATCATCQHEAMSTWTTGLRTCRCRTLV